MWNCIRSLMHKTPSTVVGRITQLELVFQAIAFYDACHYTSRRAVNHNMNQLCTLS